MTNARPVPFSAKAQRKLARQALAARCTIAQPKLDLLPLQVALVAFVFVLVLL